MPITRRMFVQLLTASTLLVFTVYRIQNPSSRDKGDDLVLSESEWKHRIVKEYIQNDQIEFDSSQHDPYQQKVGEVAPVFNDRLYQLLEKDRIANQKQQKTDTKQKNIDPSSFQSLDNNSSYIIYSAHYDVIQSVIKLVGFGPMHDHHRHLQTLSCKVKDKYNNTDQSNLYVYYRISTFSPWQGQIYDSYIYACNTSLAAPIFTTVESTVAGSVSVSLPISAVDTTPKYQFAVCVEPIFNEYSKTKSIKHFIAVNSLLGAEHFYFYVSSASSALIVLLELLPMVTVYPWHLNSLANKTHSHGQKASNAHCLYKHRHQTRYLVYIDIDEVLVPRSADSWSTMLSQVITDKTQQGAVVFQSKLFPTNAPVNIPSNNTNIQNRLWSVSHVTSVGVFKLYQWSKVLVETARTDVVDIHMVRQMLPGYTVVNADPNIAVVHHYRHFDYEEDQLNKDRYMRQFENRLLDKYQQLFPL